VEQFDACFSPRKRAPRPTEPYRRIALVFDRFARETIGQVDEDSGKTVQIEGHRVDCQHASVLAGKIRAACRLLSRSPMSALGASTNTASQERFHS